MSDVVGRVLHSLDPALREAGSSLDEVLVDHALSPDELWAHPAQRIAWNTFADVLEDAGERIGGLRAMEEVGANSLIWNWRTIIAVVSRYVRPYTAFQLGVKWFCPAIFKGIRGTLVEIPGGLVETVTIPPKRRDSPEFFALSLGVMREFPTIIGWETTELEFAHSDHRGTYRMMFARASEQRSSPRIVRQEDDPDRDLEELSILGAELATHRFRGARLAPGATPLSDRTRAIIRSEHRESELTTAIVARLLDVSERSLARRLALEGTSFRALRDEVLSEIAIDHIKSGLSIREVGGLLGFADSPSFNRAFRRWTGQTPGRYKRTWTSVSGAGR